MTSVLVKVFFDDASEIFFVATVTWMLFLIVNDDHGETEIAVILIVVFLSVTFSSALTLSALIWSALTLSVSLSASIVTALILILRIALSFRVVSCLRQWRSKVE